MINEYENDWYTHIFTYMVELLYSVISVFWSYGIRWFVHVTRLLEAWCFSLLILFLIIAIIRNVLKRTTYFVFTSINANAEDFDEWGRMIAGKLGCCSISEVRDAFNSYFVDLKLLIFLTAFKNSNFVTKSKISKWQPISTSKSNFQNKLTYISQNYFLNKPIYSKKWQK